MSHIFKTRAVQANFAKQAWIDRDSYAAMYRESVTNPDAFWAHMADEHLHWDEKWHTVSDTDFKQPHVSWFLGGKLNVSYNCIDRHLADKADQTAIIFEPDNPEDASRHITYRELYENVCRIANVMKSHGVQQGDRVCLYMPMVPEAVYTMLACARLGAIHSVVFGGFSAESLKDRIEDAEATLVVTADEGLRGGKTIPLKATVDAALAKLEKPLVKTVLVHKRTGGKINWHQGRDLWLAEEAAKAAPDCPPVPMEANAPLFILYTSGSTGKPKGVVHGTGGYLLYATTTFKYVFDIHLGDIFWCTADVGWITGHSYVTYGPLAAGSTTVVFEGVPSWPDPARFWQVVEKHKVTQFYTAPTAIRALMAQGEKWTQQNDLSSLKVLGSVGEPINPEAWEWYDKNIGKGHCPIVDTWWQTETGGHMLTPLPGAVDQIPGWATKPFFGVQPILVDEKGVELEGAATGLLCLKASWPGQMQTVFRNHDRFKDAYFSHFSGLYFSGDGAIRDKDGNFRITGRVDDVLNISGHRLGTAEIESAIVLHPKVAEAAVVGFPHDIKGQGIYAFVTLNKGVEGDSSLETEINKLVREEIGPIAHVDLLQWAPGLPKTRSGKIMRRILRKIAENELGSLGDTSTLADPAVVDDLIANSKHKD